MTAPTIPFAIDDPINTRILTISEDRVQGFHRRPFDEIARQAGLPATTILERISAMLRAGTIRRVRQTLLSNNLAAGALVAWRLPPEKLTEAFDWLFANDPFTGHVVIRTTDAAAAGATFRLWTTLKVPQGYSVDKHCALLQPLIGAAEFHAMPARKLFALGVGHMRRRNLQPGDKNDQPATPVDIHETQLSELEWKVLVTLKRELTPAEIADEPWRIRAQEAGLSHDEFCRVATQLNQRGVIGRFSTFLEHVKPLADGQRVTRFNGLFHWAVPPGMETRAGSEVGRFHILTHAYWRDGGPRFNHVNIMAVAHGTDQETVLAHKAAIDRHLAQVGIPVRYTNVFWGGRSEIKPSEVAPQEYLAWCRRMHADPATLQASAPADRGV